MAFEANVPCAPVRSPRFLPCASSVSTSGLNSLLDSAPRPACQNWSEPTQNGSPAYQPAFGPFAGQGRTCVRQVGGVRSRALQPRLQIGLARGGLAARFFYFRGKAKSPFRVLRRCLPTNRSLLRLFRGQRFRFLFKKATCRDPSRPGSITAPGPSSIQPRCALPAVTGPR